MTTFVSSTPVLHASDAVAAEAFCCGSLGFEKQFQYRNDPGQSNPAYPGVQRGDVILHLSSFPGDGVSGGAAMYVQDPDATSLRFVNASS
jgi:hypothetical protein